MHVPGRNWNGRTQSAKLPGVLPSFFPYTKLEMEECSEEGLIEHTIWNSRSKKLMYDKQSFGKPGTNQVSSPTDSDCG